MDVGLSADQRFIVNVHDYDGAEVLQIIAPKESVRHSTIHLGKIEIVIFKKEKAND